MKFVLSADWHLRGTRPRCRTDEDWLATQMTHVAFVVDLANARGLPLCLVGDIFDTPRTATEVVNHAISILKTCRAGVFILAGNHDLPFHAYANVAQCSFGTLRHVFPELGSPEAEKVLGPHNAQPFALDIPESDAGHVFTHQLVFEDDDARPMADCGKTADDVVAEFPNARWIFTGDYHTAFHRTIARENGKVCHVVNPGCLNRQVADKMQYVCKVAVVDTNKETVEWVEVPDAVDLVQDTYLREAEDKEDRIGAFLETVAGRVTVSLDFLHNLETAIQLNEIEPGVREVIQGVLETVKQGETK